MSESGKVIELSKEYPFKIEEYQSRNQVVIINFWAAFHQPCSHFNKVYSQLSIKFPKINFLQVDAEDSELADEYEIDSVPTFVFFCNGIMVERYAGAQIPELTLLIEKYDAKATKNSNLSILNNTANIDLTKLDSTKLDARIVKLINLHPVMIFIKGTPSTPQCGFSNQLIDLLNKSNITYGSFDILADEEVRRSLKVKSDWPTFPQLYINGEFIGGLDIVKELVENGEFAKLLPVEDDLSTRLGKLIDRSMIMLFMKGNSANPKCGFSRTLVQLLNDQQYDILEDDEVREGLKVYSDWPTFPQLYIKGELVGGLDIVREMIETGEFKSLISQ